MTFVILPPGYRYHRGRPNMSFAERLMESAMLPVHEWEDHVFRRVEDEPLGENVWRCECGLERFDKVEN